MIMTDQVKKKIIVKRKGLLHILAETPLDQRIDFTNSDTCNKIGKNAVHNPLVKSNIETDLHQMMRFANSFAIGRFRKDEKQFEKIRDSNKSVNISECESIAIKSAQNELKLKMIKK